MKSLNNFDSFILTSSSQNVILGGHNDITDGGCISDPLGDKIREGLRLKL